MKMLKLEREVEMVEANNLAKKVLMFLNLMREFRNPDKMDALVSALKRAGKTGIGAGAAYGIIVFLGVLSEDQSSELAKIIFTLVPAQVLIAGVSKWAKEQFGITLPL